MFEVKGKRFSTRARLLVLLRCGLCIMMTPSRILLSASQSSPTSAVQQGFMNVSQMTEIAGTYVCCITIIEQGTWNDYEADETDSGRAGCPAEPLVGVLPLETKLRILLRRGENGKYHVVPFLDRRVMLNKCCQQVVQLVLWIQYLDIS